MGQERCECRRCRNRHCRQQKQTASKGHCKLFSVCQKKLRSKNGMTLTELLAAIVILGMIGTVLGGGVMMVKKCLPEDAGSGRCRAGAVAHGAADDR